MSFPCHPVRWGICTVATLDDVLKPGFLKYQQGGAMRLDIVEIICEKNTEDVTFAEAVITVARIGHPVEMALKPGSEYTIHIPGITPFAVLGLEHTASAPQIEIAYKALAEKRHPDKKGSTEAMQRLNKARDEAMMIIQSRAA